MELGRGRETEKEWGVTGERKGGGVRGGMTIEKERDMVRERVRSR